MISAGKPHWLMTSSSEYIDEWLPAVASNRLTSALCFSQPEKPSLLITCQDN